MKKHLLYAAASLTMIAASPILAQTYSGGSGTFTGLGADPAAFPGTVFDTVDLAPVTGNYTGPGNYTLNTVTFTVGYNRLAPADFSGVLGGLTGTFNGNPFSYSVNYTIHIDAADTITLGGNRISIDGASLYISPLTLTNGDLSKPATGTLSTAVPEPATWAMLALGFGLIGFGLRSRRKQAVRFSHA